MSEFTWKIIFSVFLIAIPIVFLIIVRITSKRYEKQYEQLKNNCTQKTTARLIHYKNGKNKLHLKQWSAVYRFSIPQKNMKRGMLQTSMGEYITPPKSPKAAKPKIGEKITVYYSPVTLECYNPKDYNISEMLKGRKIFSIGCIVMIAVMFVASSLIILG